MPATGDQPVPAPVPPRPTLTRLREAVQDCRACELWADATQAVLGEGTPKARLMLVGEQPGDREDLGVIPSWDRRVACWTAGWSAPGSTASRST